MFISLSKHLGWYIFCIFVSAMNNSALIFPSFSRVHVPFPMVNVFPRVYYMRSCTVYRTRVTSQRPTLMGGFLNLHIRNPHIKSGNIAKTECLLFCLGKISFRTHVSASFHSFVDTIHHSKGEISKQVHCDVRAAQLGDRFLLVLGF